MKYFVYQYELPFSRDEYNIAQHYVVGQSEKASNKENPTVEVISDEIVEIQTKNGTQIDLNSHKVIHIDRIVPKAVKKLIPAYAEKLVEKSQTRGFDVVTTQICEAKPEAFKLIIHTITFTKHQNTIPAAFCELPADQKKVELVDLNLHKEMDLLVQSGKIIHKDYIMGSEKCYCVKLVAVETSIFGKSVIESGIGNKMKKVFLSNFKNVISSYDQWKDLKIQDIRDIRAGKGVEEGEAFQDDEQ